VPPTLQDAVVALIASMEREAAMYDRAHKAEALLADVYVNGASGCSNGDRDEITMKIGGFLAAVPEADEGLCQNCGQPMSEHTHLANCWS
jgi:hypothetical protein